MGRVITVVSRGVAVILLAGCVGAAYSQKSDVKKDAEPKKDTRVDPTSWGHIYGRVYDAKTGMPIPSAVVLGNTDNGFEEKGKSTGKTDNLGAYHIQLILGRISHNFDVGRALLSSPLGMLFGTATNTTKRIDVSRVAVSVSAAGYKPFRGVVTARSTDAGKFRIDVEPILLVQEPDAGTSVAARGWNAVRIVSASANPSTAFPKDKVKLSVSIRAYSQEFAKTTEVVAFSDLWKGAKKLKLEKDLRSDGTAAFIGDYQASGKEKLMANRVWFAVSKAKVDFDPSKSIVMVVVNTLAKGADSADAQSRDAAVELYRASKLTESRDAFLKLSKSGSKQPFDWDMAARLSMRIGDPASAVEPAGELWLYSPKDTGAADLYMSALYESGRDKDVISTAEVITKKIKDKDLPRFISPTSLATAGLSYARAEDFKSAGRVNEQLLGFPSSGTNSKVIEFRGKLRLAEVEKAHAADPKSPSALADLGRALLDLGRFEEAVAKLSESATLDPSQNTVQRDIAWAALQMKGGQLPVFDLEKAVAESRALLGLEKGQQRSKDFFTWNQYGILVFALSEQKRSQGAEDAPMVRDQAIVAIREALTLGRVGAKRNSGYFSGFTYGYLSGSEVAISGFAYPQANASFVLLDSLRKLRRNESDEIALLNVSTALLDLGQVRLALGYCDRLLALAPSFVEGRFVQGLIKHRLDDPQGAVEAMNLVIKSAPNHPRANLVLADILTELGDSVAAAECAAAHSAYYGEAPPK